MKNHWLDKKVEKEIDEALIQICDEEFKDTDFIDLSAEMNTESRYKEYDRGAEEHDRAVVTEILLKYKDISHWIDEVLSDVGYIAAPSDFPNHGCFTQDVLGNITTSTNIVSGDISGGDGIKLADLPGWKDGKIVDMDVWKGKCDTCGEYQWPMNDENTMTQGDPGCKCYQGSWDVVQQFIQNETLQIINDRIDGRDITQFQTTFTPVIPGTMTGIIYPNPESDAYGFVFTVSSDGKFDITQFVKNKDGTSKYAEWPKADPTLSLEAQDQKTLEAMANGTFIDTFMGWYDEVYTYETSLNCATGVLELHYHFGCTPKIIASYEYQYYVEA